VIVPVERTTVQTLQEKKVRGEKIVMVTAFDYSLARIVDEAGVDAILVGDSLAQVALGYDTTLPVTMEEMLVSVQAVSRGTRRALVIADMPFLSFQLGSRGETRRRP
jgi:3-methyl-2-oxobutanoate hydroxymethyltransferase